MDTEGESPFDITEHNLEFIPDHEPLHTKRSPEGNITIGRSRDLLLGSGINLAIKQYVPKSNRNPGPNDITVIGAHGNGFIKELYEPLWEDLADIMSLRTRKIRSIWIADCRSQGMSGILNEDLNDHKSHTVTLDDHVQDLQNMMLFFRAQMPPPIIAIGHSMGGNHLIALCSRLPSQFSSLVLLDPAIDAQSIREAVGIPSFIKKNQIWKSRKAAGRFLSHLDEGKWWDVSVREKWCRYGLVPNTTTTISARKDLKVATKFITNKFAQPCDVYWGSLKDNISSTIIDHMHDLSKVLCVYGERDPTAPVQEVSKRHARKAKRKETEKGAAKSKLIITKCTNVFIPMASRCAPFVVPRECAIVIANWIIKEALKEGSVIEELNSKNGEDAMIGK